MPLLIIRIQISLKSGGLGGSQGNPQLFRTKGRPPDEGVVGASPF